MKMGAKMIFKISGGIVVAIILWYSFLTGENCLLKKQCSNTGMKY